MDGNVTNTPALVLRIRVESRAEAECGLTCRVRDEDGNGVPFVLPYYVATYVLPKISMLVSLRPHSGAIDLQLTTLVVPRIDCEEVKADEQMRVTWWQPAGRLL